MMERYWRKQTFAIAIGLLAASPALADSPAPSTQPAGNTSLQSADPTQSAASTQSAAGPIDFTKMSLEDLLTIDVRSTAGLTATDSRRVPVDVTELDARDIQQSGARDLNHLLEIYVPNLQEIDHHTPGIDLGFRGIISDREDKFLYQVNGITMNNRMLYGANNERDLPLLGDIRSVSIVTGPASATHGSGALAGVIDAQTYTGLTFQGFDVGVREGLVDDYTATEFRYGKQFTPTSGLFIYYGIADVEGADSPYYIGKSFPATNGLPPNVAGQRSSAPMQDLGAAAFDVPFQKAHVSYVNGPFEIWSRFTQDGTDTRPRRDIYTGAKPAGLTLGQWTDGRPIEYQQFTTTARYKEDLSPQWNLELVQSYDFWLSKDQREGVTVGKPIRQSYEDQLFSRAIAVWKPVDSQSLAFGLEYSHFWFHDPPQSDALDRAPVVTTRYWQTDTISFLAEDQWKINNQWTSFISFRTDKNTFSDWLFSPRGTLVYTPTKVDTFKALAGQSVRRADDEDLWGQWSRTRTIAEPETLTTYELTYERKINDALMLGLNAFYEDYKAIGWNPSQQLATSLGRFQITGGELSLNYKTQDTRISLSEGVSTLLHASVPPGSPAAGEGISSAPYGFGNELANWAPSITKLSIEQDITRKWSASTSVIYYSGFPGAADYARYAGTLGAPPSGVPLTDPGYTTPFGPNVYVNVGLEYRPTEQFTIRLDGYNLAALANQKMSKRNYILRASEFSVQPASVAISLKYKF